MVACKRAIFLPQFVYLIVGPVKSLIEAAYSRIASGLRPRTSQAYRDKFSLFLAFTSYFQIPLHELDSILAFLEFLVRNGSRAHSLNTYVSVLRHYFHLLDVPYASLAHRNVHLFTKSVAINSPYTPKFKANFSILSFSTWLRLVTPFLLASFTKPSSSWLTLLFFVSLIWPPHLPPSLTPLGTSPGVISYLAPPGHT